MGIVSSVVKDVAKHNLAKKIPIVGGHIFPSKTSDVVGHYDDLKGNVSMMRNARREGASFQPKLASIIKIAQQRDRPKPSLAGKIGGGMLLGGATVAGGLLAGAAVHGVKSLYLAKKHSDSLEYIKKNDPELFKSKNTIDNFEVLKQYAPDLAANGNVAHSYLVRANQLGMTPHEFVKDLVAVQSNIDKGSFGNSASDFAMKNMVR